MPSASPTPRAPLSLGALRAAFRARTPTFDVACLWGLSCVCGLALYLQPRPLAPTQLPSLRLPRAPVRAVLAADLELARRVPEGERVQALDDNFLEQGRADDGLYELQAQFEKRRVARLRLLSEVIREHGQGAVNAIRARATVRFEALLAGEVADQQAPGILGTFPNFLARQGVTRDGRDVAPTFVARTLYKARWNALHELDQTAGFAKVERLAFFGWQALHALALAIPRRLAALDGYAKAGGERVAEARGVLLFLNAEYGAAAASLAHAAAADGSLRLRNYAEGVAVAARATGE